MVVVGLGASGLFAMANLDKNLKVLGIEKNKEAGRKLNITGGGRCNITKAGDIKDFVDCYTEPAFVRPVIYGFNNQQLIQYLESRGLPTKSENGKIIPRSEKATDVTEFFLKEIEKKGHALHFEEEIIDIVSKEDCVEVVSKASRYSCQKLLFACGGASYPQTGSDAKLLKTLYQNKMFDMTPFTSGLSALYIAEKTFEELQGVSTRVEIKYHEKVFCSDMLFAGAFLSGPVIKDLSNFVVLGDAFIIDFLPEIKEEELRKMVKEAVKNQPKKLMQNVILDQLKIPERLLKIIVKSAGLSEVKSAELKTTELNSLINSLKRYSSTVEKKFPLEKSAASKGGVKCEEVDNKTMALKSDDKIFILGDANELVGNCGGYNLQFAFSSAYRAISYINKTSKV